MATKTGPGVQQVLADTGCQKGEVRYSTRQIGLRNALKPKYRGRTSASSNKTSAHPVG